MTPSQAIEFLEKEAVSCETAAKRFTYLGNPIRPETLSIAQHSAATRTFWQQKAECLRAIQSLIVHGVVR